MSDKIFAYFKSSFMSKILKVSLFCSFALSNLFALESGFFIGAGLGAHISGVKDDFNKKSKDISRTNTPTIQHVIENIRTQYSDGQEFFPTPYFDSTAGIIYKFATHSAVRLNSSFAYTNFTTNNGVSKSHYRLDFGGDYLLALDDIPNASGLLAGAGFSITYGEFTKYLKEDLSKNPINKLKYNLPYFNVGAYKGFGLGRQFISYGVKVPLGYYLFSPGTAESKVGNTTRNDGEKFLTTSAIFYLNYAYNFEFPKTVY